MIHLAGFLVVIWLVWGWFVGFPDWWLIYVPAAWIASFTVGWILGWIADETWH